MLTVQVGQCGNQLGHTLFRKLAEEAALSSSSSPSDAIHQCAEESSFFRSAVNHPSDSSIVASAVDRRARAVLIDMEPKVIQQCLKQQANVSSASSPSSASRAGLRWEYEATNTFTKQSGSGNNWAYGYTFHGSQNQSELMDLIQTVSAAALL